MRIANRDAREYVNNCISFKGNNLFGEKVALHRYVVYSFGYHFPIYVKINGVWYGNKDKNSVTTSKHQTQACPSGEINYVSTDSLIDIIEKGCL